MKIVDLWKAKMFHVKHFSLMPARYGGNGFFSARNSWWHGLEEGLKDSESAYEGGR